MTPLLASSWFTDARFATGGADDPCLAVCESAGANADDLMAAVRLAMEDAGRLVQLRIGDDQRNPEITLGLARGLCEQRVRYVIGHFGSATARAASQVYGASNVLFLAPGSSSPALCGKHAPTTLRFFGSDDEQLECLVEAVADGKPALILAQQGNYGACLGSALFSRLARTQHRLAICYGRPHSGNVSPPILDVARVLVLGSREFAAFACTRTPLRQGSSEILLSDDSFNPAILESGIPVERCRIAFLAERDAVLVDRPVDQVRARAAALLGRPPGGYFDTAYLAARAVALAWDRVGASDPWQVRNVLLSQSWRSPYGPLRLSAEGNLTGHRWAMLPATVLRERLGTGCRAA